MRNGAAYMVVPYHLLEHSFFCRPEVGCESIDAGGEHEAQNP